jgi:hypothetical protein
MRSIETVLAVQIADQALMHSLHNVLFAQKYGCDSRLEPIDSGIAGKDATRHGHSFVVSSAAVTSGSADASEFCKFASGKSESAGTWGTESGVGSVD